MDDVEIEEPQRTQTKIPSVNPGAQHEIHVHQARNIRCPRYRTAQGFRMDLHCMHNSPPMLLMVVVELKLALKLLHHLLFLSSVFAFVGGE